MKRKIWVLSFLLALVCACLCFVGCDKKDEQKTVECSVISSTQTQVVISVTSLTGEWTLEECMEKLSTEGQITYTLSGGMLTELNGKANGGNNYWMLYTSDAEFANTSWGTVDYDGKTYASAVFGAETLPVKEGNTYIWAYQSF